MEEIKLNSIKIKNGVELDINELDYIAMILADILVISKDDIIFDVDH